MSPKRPEEEEMDEMDGQEEQQEEVVVQGKQGWLANAPWWLISVGIHAVLILGLTTLMFRKSPRRPAPPQEPPLSLETLKS